MKKIKAISLLSGGLDSTLAIKVLQKAGIDVVAITFVTPFFGAKKARVAAEKVGAILIEKDITEEHLKMVKDPAHGYGKNMNPCIDCHGLMLKVTKQIMKKEKAKFVATGEILGQRPMSQNKDALRTVEKISGLENMIVRPMCGQLLPTTIPEEKSWIKKSDLLDIRGRSRKIQMKMAEEMGIKDYPSPAGGCLLTDPEFSIRLKELFGKWPESGQADIELLKHGRHFWEQDLKIIIGRDKEDCDEILKLADNKDILLELEGMPGPISLIRGEEPQDALNKAAELVKQHSTKACDKERVVVKWALKEDFQKGLCQKIELTV